MALEEEEEALEGNAFGMGASPYQQRLTNLSKTLLVATGEACLAFWLVLAVLLWHCPQVGLVLPLFLLYLAQQQQAQRLARGLAV